MFIYTVWNHDLLFDIEILFISTALTAPLALILLIIHTIILWWTLLTRWFNYEKLAEDEVLGIQS